MPRRCRVLREIKALKTPGLQHRIDGKPCHSPNGETEFS